MILVPLVKTEPAENITFVIEPVEKKLIPPPLWHIGLPQHYFKTSVILRQGFCYRVLVA